MPRWVRILIALFCVLALAALGVWRMSYMQPSWYDPPRLNDQKMLALADRVEFRLMEEAQKVRAPADEWGVRVRDDHINSWLALRLPKWIEHQGGISGGWPAELGTPQINARADGLDVALPIGRAGSQSAKRTIILRVNPTIVDERLKLQLTGLAVGRLSLPGEPLANLTSKLNEWYPEGLERSDVRDVIDLLAGRKTLEPIVELSDGRRVRLRSIRLLDDAVDVTATTLGPE